MSLTHDYDSESPEIAVLDAGTCLLAIILLSLLLWCAIAYGVAWGTGALP